MIRSFTILKNSNKIWFVGFLLVSVAGQAQFRNDTDREIVKDVLAIFGRECGLRAVADGDVLKRLEIEAGDARRLKIPEVQKCYEDSVSQITGVYYLYDKLCQDVSANPPKIPESVAVRQLLDVSKYQSGIRPFHSLLNDCLASLPDRKGRPYIVPLTGTELDVRILQRHLNDIEVKDPFPATPEPFR